ncbi:MAG: hypothetical protein ACTSU2_15085 [Promethearchaeota archaeon]
MFNIIADLDFLPAFIEESIEKAVNIDFKVKTLEREDLKNPNLNALLESLEMSRIKVLYKRKVISRYHSDPIVPKVQYLVGFRPADGLCLYTENKIHKEILCDGMLSELSKNSANPVHALYYLLMEAEVFRIWCYVPYVEEDGSMQENLGLEMRIKLFSS